jgi:hypothetical protein
MNMSISLRYTMNPYDKHAQYTPHWVYTSHGPVSIITPALRPAYNWTPVFIILGAVVGTLAYIIIGG